MNPKNTKSLPLFKKGSYVTCRILFAVLLFSLFISCNKDDDGIKENSIVLEVSDFSSNISENPENGLALGNVDATVNKEGSLTYVLIDQSVTGAVALDSATGEFTVANNTVFDFETNTTISGNFEVRFQNESESGTFIITITNTNETSMFENTLIEVNEDLSGGQVITTFLVDDPDGDTLQFSISDDPSDLFEISGDGALSLAPGAQLDFETQSSHQITMTVSDGTDTVSEVFTITVLDVDEAIVFSDQVFQVAEDLAGGRLVGKLEATDPEGVSVKYEVIESDSNGLFEITGSDGEISLAPTATLDFETTNTYTLLVMASNANNPLADPSTSTRSEVTIEVTNVNEVPRFFGDDAFDVNEDLCFGVVIGTVSAIDPDNDDITFSIRTNDDDLFEIAPNGDLKIAQGKVLDYNIKRGHSIVVEASDGDLSTTTTIRFGVRNVADKTICFPDPNFKAELLAYYSSIDLNNDGEFQESEARAYTGFFDIEDRSITSLKGIEYFTSLTRLICDNLGLTELDVTQNTRLTHLYCSNNTFTSLDLSQNNRLNVLSCSSNPLESINLSGISQLQYVTLQFNRLTSLDLSAQTGLLQLICNGNNLAELNLSNNRALAQMWLHDNNLQSLNVANGNNTNVTSSNFRVYGNTNLSCIQVDDVSYSNSNWTSIFPGMQFSLNCN